MSDNKKSAFSKESAKFMCEENLHMIQEAPSLATRRQHTTATSLNFKIFLNMFYTIYIAQNYIWSYSQDLVARGKVFYCQIHVSC